MCGIAGIIAPNGAGLIKELNAKIAHRGPDDDGYFSDRDNNVHFAMRRLSIIDLEFGKQPMANEDESIWIVANCEIYNSPELRIWLLEKGHIFRSKNSDTEVLLHLYEEMGSELITRLNGMFAFVIYDKKKKAVFGFRDRIGIKPLYYTIKNGNFAFASELKALLILPWVSKEIDPRSLYHYVSLQFVPAPNTIFKDIKKLEAGHQFVYGLTTRCLDIKKYWDLIFNNTEEHSIDYWKSLIRDKLGKTIKKWTLSDVPVACSLSGGLDSSAIVSLLADSRVKNLRTYSLGFEDKEEQYCNELSLAREIAKKWGSRHHEIILGPEKVLQDLERMVYYLDEPYGGGLPSWYIYEHVSKDVKVCLTGTGGDELFGNYGKWKYYENLFFKLVKKAHNFSRIYHIGELRSNPKFNIGNNYWRYFSDAAKKDIVFSDSFSAPEETEALIERVWRNSGCRNYRDGVAYVDFKLQLPEEFLLVTDRFSMAHSVEARVPFLDHTLIELIYSIPASVRTKFKEPKYLLKESVKDLLPHSLLTAPKKGFVLPLKIWTRKQLRPLIEELLSPENLKKQGIFSEKLYKRMVKPHLDGFIEATPQIWTLFMFQLWHKEYCG